jgi:hypothetical protein
VRTSQAQALDHGLYRLHWKDGGSSLAAVGSDREGRRWFAPTNWISVPCTDWGSVKRAERLDLSIVDRLAELA